MLSVMMLSLLLPVTGVADIPMTAFSQQGDPPVKLWLSRDHVQLGDRVQVDVRAESDGYLLVLHAEPDGRVRVLFPIDPIHDNFVRGGDEFEIRGRGDRETFRVYASEGIGTVYAAFSRDPFQFEQFVRGNHWDYGVRDVWYVVEDPEPEITDLVLSLASGAYFDYDFVQYGVGDVVVAARQSAGLSLYADPYNYGSSFNVGINFGGYYDPVYRYRGLWRMGYTGWPSYRYGCWHSSWSCFDPFHYNYYDPWYGGGYYGYGYGGYGYNYGYGGYGYGYGYYPGYRNPTVVVYADNRLRTTSSRVRLQPSNGVNRGRRVYAGTLGSSVRRTSAANRVSPAARRLAANRVTGRTPQREVATTSTGRRAVNSPRTAPATRVTTATARRTTDATRRSVNATAQQPQRRTASRATTTRQASPTRITSTARRATPARQTPVTTRRTTPTRVTAGRPATTRSTPSRSVTSRRTPSRATPSRPTTSRSTPVRSSRPTTSRSTPVRSSRPTTSRSAPVRSSRPVTSRSAPVRSSRPTPSRSAPVRSSRPAPSRSAPVRTSRPSTVRSTPARSSARPASRKPTSTSRRRKP